MRLRRPASPMCVMRTRRAKRADKPGSVEDGHLSRRACLHAAPRTLPGRGPGRPMALLFALAPDGVCQAAASPRRWWSLTPPFQLFPLRAEGLEGPRATQVGVFFSAALSVGSSRLAVSQHPALWSPDFPHAETDVSVARPSGPLCEGHYSMPRPSKARPRAISHTVYQGLAYSELTKSLQTRLVVTYWLRNSKVIPLSRAYAQVHGLFHNKARPIVLYGPNDPGAPPIVRTVCACVTTEELASWKSL